MIIPEPPKSRGLKCHSRQKYFREGEIKRGSPPNGGADARRKLDECG
jgi:hypothetical protein